MTRYKHFRRFLREILQPLRIIQRAKTWFLISEHCTPRRSRNNKSSAHRPLLKESTLFFIVRTSTIQIRQHDCSVYCGATLCILMLMIASGNVGKTYLKLQASIAVNRLSDFSYRRDDSNKCVLHNSMQSIESPKGRWNETKHCSGSRSMLNPSSLPSSPSLKLATCRRRRAVCLNSMLLLIRRLISSF